MPVRKTAKKRKKTTAEKRESIGMSLHAAEARLETLAQTGNALTKNLAATALRHLKKAHAEFRDM